MKREMENRCLEALKKALLTKYYPSSFRIEGYGEEKICLNKVNDEWIVSQYERGINNILGRYRSILDACSAFIDEMTGGDTAIDLKDKFTTYIFSPNEDYDNNSASSKKQHAVM